MKFPDVIHVVVEEEETDNAFLVAVENGVLGINESGRRMAIYKLVSTGVVNIEKRFVEKRKR